jgi:hypothetical protein
MMKMMAPVFEKTSTGTAVNRVVLPVKVLLSGGRKVMGLFVFCLLTGCCLVLRGVERNLFYLYSQVSVQCNPIGCHG